MVTHESFKAEDGSWLYPEEVDRSGERPTRRSDGSPVSVGRVEAMSKSKRNTVDPGSIIDRYGADTARWFILSDNPPERDMEWSEAGVMGAFRFVQRLYRLSEVSAGPAPEQPQAFDDAAVALRRVTHRAIAAVTQALDDFAFNVAVARLYELASAIADADRSMHSAGMAFARREAVEMAARLAAPMMPHLAEQIFARLHGDAAVGLVADLPWPKAVPALVAVQSVTIAVQIMGKLRGTIEAPPGARAELVIAAAEREPNVARQLEGKRVVKRIHVPDRIVNFVVAL
jgi:leucyl-tRNA synthetase